MKNLHRSSKELDRPQKTLPVKKTETQAGKFFTNKKISLKTGPEVDSR